MMGKNEFSIRKSGIGIFVIGLILFVASLLFPDFDESVKRLIYGAIGSGALLTILSFSKKDTLEMVGAGAVAFILGLLMMGIESSIALGLTTDMFGSFCAILGVWALILSLGSLGGKEKGLKLIIELSAATIVAGLLLVFGGYSAFLEEVGPLLVVGGIIAMVTGFWFSKLPKKKSTS